MAHEIDLISRTDLNGSMAFIEGQTPWHGLGQTLTPDAPFEVWLDQAGMNFQIEEAPVLWYDDMTDEVNTFPDRKILYRNDTRAELGITGDKTYNVVQPSEILEFHRSLVESANATLETAGVLFGGKRFWSLSRMTDSFKLATGDTINSYLLAMSGVGISTRVKRTSVCVVCNNTLEMSLRQGGQSFAVPHSTSFNPDEVKGRLGLEDNYWSEFCEDVQLMASRVVTDAEAAEFFLKVLGDMSKDLADPINANNKNMAKVIQLFKGGAMGSELASRKDTAWGLVSAVTEFADHHRLTKSLDARFDAAQFGDWAKIKADSYQYALQLAA